MKKNTPPLRAKPLALAVAYACAGASSMLYIANAYAQGSVEEITVTGSRIQRETGFTTPVPVTAVTPDELSNFQPGRTMADQLDQLPQFFQTQSAQRGGGALFGSAGISALNMRSMGPQRTLVLLDGARVSPADRDGSVHIDNFPTALISQVEVVTGGASAQYGADALAGVTNFRLNRTYEGLDFKAGVGTTEAGFGDQLDLSAAWGTEIGERMHFIGSLETQNIDPIDPEPTELGGWFRRYGIVANPASNATNGATEPQRLVLPDVHNTGHSPTGRIGACSGLTTTPACNLSFTGQNFTYAGTGTQPFVAGNPVGAATQNQSGGPEADIANRAFNGPIYGAEVKRRSGFAGFTFDANETTRYTANLFAGATESNDYDQRGIPHLSGIWNGRLFATNPYLPAAIRQEMITEGIDSFILNKQGTVLDQPGNWNDDEKRHNQFDSWTVQLGLEKDLGDNWNMQLHVQRGATDRYTTVYNEVRVDREFLALDAVEVFNDRRDVNGDRIVDLIGDTDNNGVVDTYVPVGTGTIICNVQRYNPTSAQLQDSVDGYPGNPAALPAQPARPPVLVPQPQGDTSLGGPADLVPIPGPVGPDAISNCTPLNALGQGNVSQAAHDYLVSQKEGIGTVTQEFAEILFTGDIWQGYGPGAFSMAGGATWRKQWFWQEGLPREIEYYGPPRNAPEIGIRGIATTGFENGSANLHEFSTVPKIEGGFDVWELFAEFNMPLWESDSGNQRFEIDVAGRHSDYSTSGGIDSWKTGINFQLAQAWRLRATQSRDVREPTFAERYNLQGGGGNVNDPAFNGQNFEITVTTGGNPDLEPEIADTTTAGIVFQPANVGVQVSVDWYDIDLSKAVGTLGQQNIVNGCAGGNTQLCPLITRDPLTGVIGNVRNVFLNIDKARVRGIDYEVVYNTEPDWAGNQSESLSFRLLAGRLLEDSTTLLSGTVPIKTDLANRYFEPDLKLIANVRYQIGSWWFNLQERYIPETTLDGASLTGPAWAEFTPGVTPGVLPTGAFTIDDNTVQSKAYTDLVLAYEYDMGGDRSWEVSLAISNLLDEDPPVIPSFDTRFSSQTAAGNSYDVYGRRYLAQFRYRF